MTSRGAEALALVELPNGWTVGRFAALDGLPGVVHTVTTRRGFDVAAAGQHSAAAAQQVAEALGLDGMASCRQVHGSEVLVADRPGAVGRADGLVTDAPSLGLAGFSADCPIILAADAAGDAVGMAHASWRGTVGRIASRLIQRMAECFGAWPADVVACIGPGAGACCYEVGHDVLAAARSGIGPHAEQFFQTRGGSTYFDLPAANADELARAGVHRENIHAAGLCTICRDDLFPSYRREGRRAGRFVAAIARRRK